MKTIFSLFWLQQKSKVKNIFKKPITAILTAVGILFFGGMMALMLFGASHLNREPIPNGYDYIAWLSVGMMGFMLLSQALQTSKQALFFVEDSYYLFTMPLTKKQVIGYLILKNILYALYFGVFVLFMCTSLSMPIAPLTGLATLVIMVMGTLSSLLILMLQDYYYLMKIAAPEIAKKVMLGLKVLLGLAVAGILFVFYQNDFNVLAFAPKLVTMQALNYIPIIGWMKAAVVAAFVPDFTTIAFYFGLLLATTLLFAYMLLNFKGEFYEEALQDSEEFSNAYRAAKTGKASIGKVHDVSESMQMNEKAFFSKEILMLKKTRQFLKKEDMMIIVMYLFISYLSGMDFASYARLMFIWLFISMMRSSIGNELKNPYIYLAPGNPRKKMFAIALPPMITPAMMITVSYVIGGIVFKAAPLQIIEQLISSLSMIPLLLAGNVFALRILKGQSNMIVENLLRLVIMFVIMIPTLIASVMLFMVVGNTTSVLVMVNIILAIFNLFGAYLVFYFCAPMLNGGDVSDF